MPSTPHDRGPSRVPSSGTVLADIVEWDVANWACALPYWLQHSALRLGACQALEIGSRHGGLSLWLALCGADVVCSDLDGPTDLARQKHARYGVSSRVTYRDINALDIPYENTFDLVAVKSVLGGIGRDGHAERQHAAIEQMYRALKPGGELWFAENLTGSPLHRALRGRFVRWGTSWRYPSAGELTAFLQPFESIRCSTHGVLGALGRTERQRALLGRLDGLFVNALVPGSWRYIAFGVARKKAAAPDSSRSRSC
jgi:SAM-dependent methyltransferase